MKLTDGVQCSFCGQRETPGRPHVHAEQSHALWGHAGDLATAENAPAARKAAIAFFDETQPGHTEKEAEMLPVPCSPTGAAPATHYFCWWKAKRSMIEAGIEYATRHGHPNIIEFADSPAEFLARHQLKVIG
jgi:hypothetical protein